jgi:hypothetical protein
MARFKTILGMVTLMAWGAAAAAQDSSTPYSSADEVTNAAYGLEASSLAYEEAEEIESAAVSRLGPTAVSSVGTLMDLMDPCTLMSEYGIRTFGWVEAGYTDATVGPGLMSVQPRQNRFGDEFLFNQVGLVLQRPLSQDELDLGFNVRYFAGADAALGQPLGGIDDPPSSDHFSQDFRDLNVSAHLPVFTELGMDVKVGRMNTIIGYNGFLAPYRPFYSSDYQFFYSQDGAFTGFLTNLHVTEQLDVWNGMTLGANTFYTKRSEDSYCYIGQVNYWTTMEKRTRLTASVYAGPDSVFAAPAMAGDFATTLELRALHNWSDAITQVVQSNMGWDANTPVGTGSWYGLYTIGIFHLTCNWDFLARAEWFRDVHGTRTGIDANYAEGTLGLNWHPTDAFEVRPEVRGDFADELAFGTGGVASKYEQLTAAISCLYKF